MAHGESSEVPVDPRQDRLRNQLEGLLEEAQIKLSSVVSDLFGSSGRRMLAGLVEGVRDAGALAALADRRLRATQEQLRDALFEAADEEHRPEQGHALFQADFIRLSQMPVLSYRRISVSSPI